MTGACWSFVTFAPDGRLLAGSGNGKVLAWDLTGPVPVRSACPRGSTTRWCSRGRGVFAVAPPYGAPVVLWDEAGPVATLPEATGPVAFSPRRTAARRRRRRLPGLPVGRRRPGPPRLVGNALGGRTAYVQALAVSPDGRLLVSGGRDGLLFVRDLTDPLRPHLLAGPITLPDVPTSAVFAPDEGRRWRWRAGIGRAPLGPGRHCGTCPGSRPSRTTPSPRPCVITRGGLSSPRSGGGTCPPLRYGNACP